jgi:hypothetical protein
MRLRTRSDRHRRAFGEKWARWAPVASVTFMIQAACAAQGTDAVESGDEPTALSAAASPACSPFCLGSPDPFELLFEHGTFETCELSPDFAFGDLVLQNNQYMAGPDGLEGKAWTCTHYYRDARRVLFGWDWSLPATPAVYVYPEVIYGLKPWSAESTTALLPAKVADAYALRVDYAVATQSAQGSLNLAFDVWITATSASAPEDIRFELMIWEARRDMVPFGSRVDTNVTTSNGSYELYVGEPDWEPPGTNWTYLAFARKESRGAGRVEIGQFLKYLVRNGYAIDPAGHYVSSVELGNELGSGSGRTVVTDYRVSLGTTPIPSP